MFGKVLRWLRCRMRLCTLAPSYDDEGIFWQCPACGKTTR